MTYMLCFANVASLLLYYLVICWMLTWYQSVLPLDAMWYQVVLTLTLLSCVTPGEKHAQHFLDHWELQGKKLNRTEQFHEVSVTVFPDQFFYRIKLLVQSLFNISSRWVRVYLYAQRDFGAEKKILVSKKRYQGETAKFCRRFRDGQ